MSNKKLQDTADLVTKAPKLDMSNIANIDAVESKGDKQLAKSVKKQSANKYIQTEFERIPLPSGGKIYEGVTNDEDILNGFIQIREMKGHDEKILSTQRYLKDGSFLKRLLDNCIVSDIESSELANIDFNYLIFALRKLSYGDDYKFKQRCSNSFCEKQMDLDCKISELKFNELPKKFKEPITIKLPRSKFTVKKLLERVYHTEAVQEAEKNEKKRIDDEDKTRHRMLAATTISIISKDGKEVPEDDYELFYGELSAADLAEIREKSNFQNDIEGKEVICPYCDTTQKVPIPLGTEFFRLQ